MWLCFKLLFALDNKYLYRIGSCGVKSIFIIAEEILRKTGFEYLLTYKFSRNHLEMFFFLFEHSATVWK